ncbi:MAG: hypothetical protein ACOY7L_11145 [Pseudomonadota bacterium]|jgi:hypothetical protein
MAHTPDCELRASTTDAQLAQSGQSPLPSICAHEQHMSLSTRGMTLVSDNAESQVLREMEVSDRRHHLHGSAESLLSGLLQ